MCNDRAGFTRPTGLQTASEAELAAWAERVLFAEGLEQVFSG